MFILLLSHQKPTYLSKTMLTCKKYVPNTVQNDKNIYLNLNESYFQFHDVDGDGNCFFHSILMNKYFSDMFDHVQALRLHLKEMVLYSFRHDHFLQQIFSYYGKNYNTWCNNIVQSGRWADPFDTLMLSYITKWNIVVVGNYMHGIILTSTQETISNLINLQQVILQNGTIHILYHVAGRPLERMLDGNHFAYLEPIGTPTLNIGINSIQQGSGPIQHNNGREIWTKEDNIELYRCYCLSMSRHLKKGNGTLQIWKDRNPNIKPHLNVTTIFYQLKKSEQILSDSEKDEIIGKIKNGIPEKLKNNNKKRKIKQEKTIHENTNKKSKIAQKTSKNKKAWTEKENEELHRCHGLALHTGANMRERRFNMWRTRNPSIRTDMNKNTLDRHFLRLSRSE